MRVTINHLESLVQKSSRLVGRQLYLHRSGQEMFISPCKDYSEAIKCTYLCMSNSCSVENLTKIKSFFAGYKAALEDMGRT